MKNLMKLALMLPLTASLILTGCDKKDDEIVVPTPPPVHNPIEGKVLVASGTSDEADVDIRVYADQDLFVGYNKLYTVLLKKGTQTQVNGAHVTYHPMMTMNTGMSHTCPTENPSSTDPIDGLFDGAVIFIMPSSEMGTWTLEVHVHNHSNGFEGEAELDVSVEMPIDTRVFSFESPVDMKNIFITLAEPSSPEVGMNDLVVMAHFKQSMMSFPAMAELNIEFEPMMPSMGHGSPNNENPVHMSMGHYQGVVNFTMSGFWQLEMTVKDNSGATLDDTHSFDVNF